MVDGKLDNCCECTSWIKQRNFFGSPFERDWMFTAIISVKGYSTMELVVGIDSPYEHYEFYICFPRGIASDSKYMYAIHNFRFYWLSDLERSERLWSLSTCRRNQCRWTWLTLVQIRGGEATSCTAKHGRAIQIRKNPCCHHSLWSAAFLAITLMG